MDRPHYPLTDEAKEAARNLSASWGRQLEQYSEWVSMLAAGETEYNFANVIGAAPGFGLPRYGVLQELGHYGLLTLTSGIDQHSQRRMYLNLLQELRNAVENDFLVSDYFLTLNAVGTIVHGNVTVESHGAFQSAAGFQATNVNVGKLVGDLRVAVGESALRENPALAEAIAELESSADEPTRRAKLGKVVLELGRGMQHVANFAGTLTAIGMFAQMFAG